VADLSRRGFIKNTGIGAATLGALVTMPGLAAAHAAEAETPAAASPRLSGSFVAFVRDASRGEIILMVDEREVVVHDPDLVKRLQRAIR
jgi:anaerobic selenocysteine-containing dehydrogenase